ncbi:SIMPL domain-containing protein [Vulcanococcus limneticus Candia 3F8]|uniref:SIMPL domain-containing protein n=1 Tax=Vulcanococcus limneticus TaxID=2170428 RepID=UPI0020CFDD7A|nr:SIMPL domain-containing protein [Vulcanococcus limneticus]MCP9894403.1 SIMPL domain-containing protein [Vulcanococcus limneticus Candia 3F8]
MAPLASLPQRGWTLLRRTPPLVFAMAVLGVGLIGASTVLVKGIRQANDTITVTGTSTERIRSDYVDWSVEVRQGGASQQAAYQALQPLVQQVVTFLKAKGIAADELELDAVGTEKEEVRDPRTGELRSTSWTARQAVKVGSRDVEKVHRIAGEIGVLIGQGVPLTINRPAYTFTGLAEKRVEMLAKATRDARARAQAIAREAGSGIGAITNADTGSFQITVPDSTETSDTGSYDTTTIQKDITAVMAVTFRVN